MNGSPPIGTSPGFVAPLFRTSLGPGEAPPAPSASVSTARLNLTPIQASALGGTSSATTLNAATGSGAATRPSLADRAAAFVVEKFDRFCGLVGGFKDSARETLAGLKNDAVDFMKEKLGIRDEAPLDIKRAPSDARPLVNVAADAAYARSPKADWLSKPAVDLTSHASPQTIADVKNIVSKELARSESNPATFMRSDTELKNIMNAAGGNFAVSVAIDEYNKLPDNKVLLVQEKSFNGTNRVLPEYPDLNIALQYPDQNMADGCAAHAKGYFERMLGTDEQGARDVAQGFPQAVKDIYRATVDEIRASNFPSDKKASFEEKVLSNLFLHVVSPRLTDVVLPDGVYGKSIGAPPLDKGAPPPLAMISMTDLAVPFQTFVNTGDVQVDKAKLHPTVKAELDTIVPQMRTNLKAIGDTLYAQGTPVG